MPVDDAPSRSFQQRPQPGLILWRLVFRTALHQYVSATFLGLTAVLGSIGTVNAAISLTGDVTPTYPASNPDPWMLPGDLAVAESADGMLLIDQGSQVTSMGGSLGFALGTEANVTVSGSNSAWNMTGNLLVGTFGSGHLEIVAGGTVQTAIASLGHVSGMGETLVSGAGSLLQTTDTLYVGNSAQGGLILEEGGHGESPNAWVGFNSGAVGNVEINGPGSEWLLETSLQLGTSFTTGRGSLSLSSGGGQLLVGDMAETSGSALPLNETAILLDDSADSAFLGVYDSSIVTNSGNAYLGYAAGSSGAALVAGPTAHWQNSGQLHLGTDGTALLTLENGGSLTAAGGITIGTGGQIQGDGNLIGVLENHGTLAPSVAGIAITGDYLPSATAMTEIAWDATSGTAPYLSSSAEAQLAGSLVVTFAEAFQPNSGDAIEILTAAAGVSGEFETLQLPELPTSQMWWLSYGENSVQLGVTVPGDFNFDGSVNEFDLEIWQEAYGNTPSGDANLDRSSNGADFLTWQRHLSSSVALPLGVAALTVPEPSVIALIGVMLTCCGGSRQAWR